MRRSASAIGTSLMLASLRLIRPSSFELPQLIAVAAVPLPAGVVGFVLEADGDPVALEGPHVLPQRIVKFTAPFPAQELDDHGSARGGPHPACPDPTPP